MVDSIVGDPVESAVVSTVVETRVGEKVGFFVIAENVGASVEMKVGSSVRIGKAVGAAVGISVMRMADGASESTGVKLMLSIFISSNQSLNSRSKSNPIGSEPSTVNARLAIPIRRRLRRRKSRMSSIPCAASKELISTDMKVTTSFAFIFNLVLGS